MHVTVQNASSGQRAEHRRQRLGAGIDPARHAEHEVDSQRRGENPLIKPPDGADDVSDVEHLDLETDSGFESPSTIPRPAGGGVMNVSSPKFIDPDSTPERSGRASRPVVRSSIVMSLEPPVETIVTMSLPGTDPLHDVEEQLGAPARRAVILAYVEVDDRRPRGGRLDARLRDLGRRIRDVLILLAKNVGAGDGDRQHDRVAVPFPFGHLLTPCSSLTNPDDPSPRATPGCA